MKDCGNASNSNYTRGCRCDACRAAHTRAAKVRELRNASGNTYYVDAEPIREHIVKLFALGYTKKELMRMGIPGSTIRNLMTRHHRSGKPTTRMRREMAERILAIKGRRLGKHQLVDARAARVLLTGWRDAGVSVAEIKRVTGLSRSALDNIIHGRTTEVYAETLVCLLSHKPDLDLRVEDMRERNARRSYRDTLMATHSDWEVEEMYRLHLNGMTYAEISTRYGTYKKALCRAFKKLKEREVENIPGVP